MTSAPPSGASAMVIAVVLHLFRTFWFGSYRKPRELNWLAGVGLRYCQRPATVRPLHLNACASQNHFGYPSGSGSLLRGQRVGNMLLEKAIDDARAQGFKIFALCPFAAAQFRRHPEYRAVLST